MKRNNVRYTLYVKNTKVRINGYRVSQQFLLFGLIGALNTSVHSAVVVGLVESKLLNPVLANFFAFLVANQLSFILNCRFTFHASPRISLYGRFFLVSLASLIATIALSGYAEWMEWHYGVGLLLVIGFGPPLTFFLQKHWAFKLIDGEQPVKLEIKNDTSFNQIVLVAFCLSSLFAIVALALTINGLGPIDDHQFIRTIFQGKSFGAYVMPELGRFFPLTAQEYALATRFFEASPFLFQLINCAKIFLCGSLLYYCLALTKASNFTIIALWSTIIFSVGFSNSVFRYHVGEINALILILFFISTTLAHAKVAKELSAKQKINVLSGVIAMIIAFLYKELIFIFPVAFGTAEIFRYYRQKKIRIPAQIWLLLSAGIMYIILYGYWRTTTSTNSYANYHSASTWDVVSLFFKNDPFIFFVLFPLTAFRSYVALMDAKQHTIFDSFLVASSAYVIAYFVLGIFNTYYLLPAYGFAVCGIAGVLATQTLKKFNRFISLFTGLLAINLLPTAISDMQTLKAIANNHYKFIHSLSEWILLNPLPNSEPRNLVLNEVNSGTGVELIFSLKTFLTSFGVPNAAFNVKHTNVSDNKVISSAYGVQNEATYTAKINDVLIFNPYQQVASPPPPLTPSYRQIFRSESEWTFPRRSVWAWFDICIFKQHDCSFSRPGDMRYTGYAALLIVRSPADVQPSFVPVLRPSYRIGPILISSRLRVGTTLAREILIMNTGEDTWPADGTLDKTMLVNLAYVWVNVDGKVVLEGNRASFQEPIRKNDVAKVSILIKTPDEPGKYRLIVSPVQEGNRWFYPSTLDDTGKEIEAY